MTCWPGHNSASACTRALAWSRVCPASTECRLPSPRNLKMQKGGRIQAPNGDDLPGGTAERLSHQFGMLGTGYATYQSGVHFVAGSSAGFDASWRNVTVNIAQ